MQVVLLFLIVYHVFSVLTAKASPTNMEPWLYDLYRFKAYYMAKT